MITCERTRALLSLYALGDLRPDAAAATAEHVASCADCRQEYERIRSTIAHLRDALAEAPDAPPRLSEERRRQVLATVPGGLLARRPLTPRPEFWLARHHRGLAVAAGLLVVLGLLWPALTRSHMESLSGRTGKLDGGGLEVASRPAPAVCREPAAAVNMPEEKLKKHRQSAGERRGGAPDSVEYETDGLVHADKPSYGGGTHVPEKSAREDLHAWTIEGWLEKNESDTVTASVDSRYALNSQPKVGRAFLPDRVALESQPGMADLPRLPEQLPDKDDFASGPGAERSALSRDANRADEKEQQEAARMPADRLRAQHAPKPGEAFKARPPEPADLSFSPAPAEFDSIAMTQSPVVMRGLNGSRESGEADRQLGEREQLVGGMAYEPKSQSGIGGEGRLKGKNAKSAHSPFADATDLSAEIPVIGRLFETRSAARAELGIDRTPDDKDILPPQPDSPPPAGSAAALPVATKSDTGKETYYRFLPAVDEAGGQAGEKEEDVKVAFYDAPPARDGQPASARKPMERSKKPGGEDANGETRSKPRARAYGVNPFTPTAADPLSTFSIDVDTASYTMARRYMHEGVLPPVELVRTEEFVNAFDYAYRAPTHATFRIDTELAPSPFGTGLHLLKIGVKGRRLGREEQRPAVLTLVIDTSGSMNQPDRLELAQAALRLLVDRLGPRDRVAVIQYDSHARVALDYTSATRKTDILAAIDGLQCRGSTNLEEAMQQAYALAVRAFVPGAENRVILMSDGVANMGADSAEAILGKVEANRRQGITCSVLGFGMVSYDDAMLESLANKGDGVYSFIDSLDQARRIFVDDLAATLNTIARDVKIQVQFNPAWVVQHRQLGYENRQLAHRDFRNDAVDAGEVGSGQSVTALYECELQPAARTRDADAAAQQPVATVRVRYRRVATGAVEELRHDVWPRDVRRNADELPAEFRLAACVAEFAELLRGSPFALGSDFEAVARLLRPVALELHLDTRVQELLRLVHAAGSLGTAADADAAP